MRRQTDTRLALQLELRHAGAEGARPRLELCRWLLRCVRHSEFETLPQRVAAELAHPAGHGAADSGRQAELFNSLSVAGAARGAAAAVPAPDAARGQSPLEARSVAASSVSFQPSVPGAWDTAGVWSARHLFADVRFPVPSTKVRAAARVV